MDGVVHQCLLSGHVQWHSCVAIVCVAQHATHTLPTYTAHITQVLLLPLYLFKTEACSTRRLPRPQKAPPACLGHICGLFRVCVALHCNLLGNGESHEGACQTIMLAADTAAGDEDLDEDDVAEEDEDDEEEYEEEKPPAKKAKGAAKPAAKGAAGKAAGGKKGGQAAKGLTHTCPAPFHCIH